MAKLTFNKLKNTDAIWLPQVPEHWELVKVRHLFKESTRKGFPDETLLVASQEHGVVSKDTYGKRTVEATKDLQNLKLVEQGDFVISLRSFQGGIELAHVRGIISPAYTVMKETRQIEKRYFKNLFKSPPFIALMTLCVKGIREGQNIDYPTFKNEYLPFPPLEEQKAISAYLDKKNNEIDQFIRNKERLVELLEEEKISIIHQSIANNKDSERKRLKFVCFLSRGYDLSSDKFKEGKYPIYGSNGIIGYHNVLTTKAPCITVGRSGSVGEVNYVETDFWAHNTSLYVYRNYNNDWKFLYYLLLTLDMKSYAAGSAVGSLNRNNVHEIIVNIPKIEEQINIAKDIENELDKINSIISKAQKEISSIKEYREALITDLVTGKRSVPQLQMS